MTIEEPILILEILVDRLEIGNGGKEPRRVERFVGLRELDTSRQFRVELLEVVLDAPNAERPHALHLQLTMTPGTPSLDPPFSRNFRRLVLGCIKTDFYNQILILQDFSRSTRFTFLCTAPNSNFQQKIIKLFDIFY